LSGARAAPRVLVVGDVMTDIICRPEGPLVTGSDRRAKIVSRPGGSGANQAVWLAACGLAVRFAARVAAADREAFAARFATLGVETAFVADPDLPSGTLVTLVSPDGERSFLTDRGANLALSPADLPDALLDGCARLVVSGYSLFEPSPRAAVTGLMARAAARGIETLVDAASVGFLQEIGAESFFAWTAGIGTLFANADEAAALTGMTSLDAQMQALAAHYPRVVVKLGGLGAALLRRGGRAVSLPAPAVTIVDSTGAGDAFAAAFIAAELADNADEACLRAAIAAGAEAVQHVGGQPAS
jgi:sugar/nucleoside kinase (ribokinase family)